MPQAHRNVWNPGDDPLGKAAAKELVALETNESQRDLTRKAPARHPDSHGAGLDEDAVPVNLVIRELGPPSERARGLQGLLGGSGVSSAALPA